MRKISYLGWGVLLLGLILSGCGELDRKGSEPVNENPEVFFSNTPPESLRFSVNPCIYWYGTDKDGYVAAYQYAVIRDDSISEVWGELDSAKKALERIEPDSVAWVNYAELMNIIGVHVPAEKGHERNVRMYAEMDPDDSTAQHIFLRGVDNDGAVSEIKTRMYWRNNHLPEIFIDVDEDFVEKNLYCLPDTNATWGGIEISWHGLDTSDYPDMRKQPDFYYKWELWGPYADTSELGNGTMVDFSLDSIQIGDTTIYDTWVLHTYHIFKNLENYCENDSDFGYGWYQLRVWSRDDALVSSKDSATTFLRILKPHFRYDGDSTILVLDAGKYPRTGGPTDHSEVRPFYETALSALLEENICDNFNIYFLGDDPPLEDSLSRYDLVIVLNVGGGSGLTEERWCRFEDYLKVGGRLWIMGMNNYGLGTIRARVFLTGFMAKMGSMFGVIGGFNPGYSPSEAEVDWLDFIAAEPFGSWDLPFLEMDTTKTKELEGYDPENEAKNYPVSGIPHVSFEILSAWDFAGRSPLYRRLYSFVSRRGSKSDLEGMPCATTFIGPTYRTAEFTFPLHLMKDTGAQETFRRMVGWFLDDLPEP